MWSSTIGHYHHFMENNRAPWKYPLLFGASPGSASTSNCNPFLELEPLFGGERYLVETFSPYYLVTSFRFLSLVYLYLCMMGKGFMI